MSDRPQHYLFHGDCKEQMLSIQMLQMKGELPFFDITVTSPPYNIGIKEDPGRRGWKGITAWDDAQEEAAYQDQQVKRLQQIWDLTREGGACFYNHKVRNRDWEIIHPMAWISRTQWIVRQIIVWDKGNTHQHEQGYCYPTNELIFWLTKGKEHTIGHNSNGYGTVWTIYRVPPVKRKWKHNAPFPIEVPRRCLALAADPGDWVFDPYIGSGTTGQAAIEAGMNIVGIEKMKEYWEMSKERLGKSEVRTMTPTTQTTLAELL